MPVKVSEVDLIRAKEALKTCGGSFSKAAKLLGIPRTTLLGRIGILERRGDYDHQAVVEEKEKGEKRNIKQTADTIEIDYVGSLVKSPDELIADAEIDLNTWEVYEVNVNNWEVGGKISKTNEEGSSQHLWKMPLRQIKIKLRKKK